MFAIGDGAQKLAFLQDGGIGLERGLTFPDRDDQGLAFVPCAVDTLLQNARHPGHFEGHMNATGRRADRFHGIGRHRIAGAGGAEFQRLFATLGRGFDHMNLGRTGDTQGLDHQKTDRPGAEDRGRVARFDL